VGLLLGWPAVPAILVALALQGAFFQFGGITTLGVNTVIMALPAVLCYFVFKRFLQSTPRPALAAAFAAGALALLMSGLLVATALIFTDENFFEVSALILGAHLPIMVIEGMITAACIGFLRRVKPDMLPGARHGAWSMEHGARSEE
jgi:cobalt/nickel transport system permease protein